MSKPIQNIGRQANAYVGAKKFNGGSNHEIHPSPRGNGRAPGRAFGLGLLAGSGFGFPRRRQVHPDRI